MDIIKIISKVGAKEILNLLSEKERRDNDIKKIVPRDATRRNRIKELEDLGLIERKPIKIKRNYITHYFITLKGEKVLENIKQMEQI